jgi:hypothetical protein
MPHHTKDKGDLGVLKAQADLATQGFTILLPLTEHAPFDLVVYKDGRFRRVQVRYRTPTRTGSLFVNLRSVWCDRHGIHTRPMNKTEVDLVCVYCPTTDLCYYFDPNKYRASLNLRLTVPRNGQKKRVKFASEFRVVPDVP